MKYSNEDYITFLKWFVIPFFIIGLIKGIIYTVTWSIPELQKVGIFFSPFFVVAAAAVCAIYGAIGGAIGGGIGLTVLVLRLIFGFELPQGMISKASQKVTTDYSPPSTSSRQYKQETMTDEDFYRLVNHARVTLDMALTLEKRAKNEVLTPHEREEMALKWQYFNEDRQYALKCNRVYEFDDKVGYWGTIPGER